MTKFEERVVPTGQPVMHSLVMELNKYLADGWVTHTYEDGMWLLRRPVTTKAKPKTKQKGDK